MRSLAPALLGQQQKRVLILDDEPAVVHSLSRALKQISKGWVCETATDPEDAWYRVLHTGCDVLVTDIRMPKIDGLALLERMQRDPKTEGIPVVIVTGLGDESLKLRALKLGAVDLLTKPVDTHYLAARIHQALRWKEGLDVLAVLNSRLQSIMHRQKQEIASHHLAAIWRLIVLIEQRNPVLGHHSVRVANFARRFAEHLGFTPQTCERIFWAAALHDVGKAVLPDAVLQRDLPLSPGEMALLEKHCLFGEQILRGRSISPVVPSRNETASKGEQSVFDTAAEVALNHHERWDGMGFPHRRARDGIPLVARLVSICDVFDHIVAKSAPIGAGEVLAKAMLGYSGSALDPELTQSFVAHLADFRRLAEELKVKVKAEPRAWGGLGMI
ncbi:MAG: response regulator [Thermogutta sp.]